MTIYDLKPRFQSLLRPACQVLARAGVTPNQVTLVALGLSVSAGLLITLNTQAQWPLLLLPAVLFLRMALNALDGMLAREHHQQTSFGAVLNELGDVISDAVLYLPLATRPQFSNALIVGIVTLAMLSEMTGVVAVQIGGHRRYDGPMGKSDRAFCLGGLALLAGLGIRATPWIPCILWMLVLLLGLTIYNRASRAIREVTL